MNCINGRCWSPVACGGFGYCRDRNLDGFSMEDAHIRRRRAQSDLELVAVELAKLPNNVYWVLAKGRLTPTEPLWAVRITDLAGETILETEGDHPADTVRAAADKLSILHEEKQHD
jgi:hypothetical protein